MELAIMLRDLFDAKGYYVETELIPDQNTYTDSITGEHKFVLFPTQFPSVYLTRDESGTWRYSERTVSRIPELYDQYIPSGSGFLQKLIPGDAKHPFLGVAIWKWLGIFLILGISYALYRLLNLIFGLMFKRILPRFTPRSYVDPQSIPPVAKPLSVVMVLMLLRSYFMPMLLLPIDFSDPLGRLFTILMSAAGIVVFYKLVDVFASVFQNLASRTETSMDDQLIPLLSKTAKLVIIVFGLLFILDNLDVDVTALLAGVSIGGLALALAAQDTVKNFIGSISIFVDRPFVIGDFIQAGDIRGTIMEVGVRTTRIRAADGATVTVPNGELAGRTITNHSMRDYRRYSTSITVTYETIPAKMEEFVDEVRKIVTGQDKVREGSAIVQFHEMNASSLDIFYAAIFNVTDYAEWLACRQEILLKIINLATEMNIEFAFPSTSLYIESMPTS